MNRGGEKVAFIAHPVDAELFASYCTSLRPDKKYDPRLLLKLFEWTKTYSVKELPGLSFDGKHSVDAELFMVPFLPEMGTISVKAVIDKIDGALALARSRGCTIAALGGFTSIVLQGLERRFSEKHGMRLTSGNALTAVLIIRSIEEITGLTGLDLSASTMAIIGASGDIGSACARYFCTRVARLQLSGRSLPALRDTVERNASEATAEIEITNDNAAAVRNANLCVFVTSAHVPLFDATDFLPGTIVCDASAPPNVTTGNTLRDDVFIYHGGIAAIPFPVALDFDIGLASPYTFYGCQLEGLLIGLHPRLPCSWGRGNITPEHLRRVADLLDGYRTLRPAYTIGNIGYSDEQLREYCRRMAFSAPRRPREIQQEIA